MCVSAAPESRTLTTYALSWNIYSDSFSPPTSISLATEWHQATLCSYPGLFFFQRIWSFPDFYPLCAHPVRWTVGFVFDDLLINKTCPVSLDNLDPQPKHPKAQQKSRLQGITQKIGADNKNGEENILIIIFSYILFPCAFIWGFLDPTLTMRYKILNNFCSNYKWLKPPFLLAWT